MFTKAILPDTLRAIQLVSKIPIIQNAYLAGGTALTLQLGHRISIDLDFFTPEAFDEKILASSLGEFPQFIQEGTAWRTVWGKVGETKFSLFYYKYPLIGDILMFENLCLASKKDIAAMKIHAVSDRGTKRDFVDLYMLAQEFGMNEILMFYDDKYGDLDEKAYHLIRSLDYFSDAEAEPSDKAPKMLIDLPWEKVRTYFANESLRLAHKYL
ncbi:nucleotidyl transferase AbiEii/AbiGii toxin family protein [Candidatus Amesbacteria bacterium]|nr:nucleotidyl transferase AbiEii/AbiGii toxin family protein [Candidatus Amesbacteria bacterium]